MKIRFEKKLHKGKVDCDICGTEMKLKKTFTLVSPIMGTIKCRGFYWLCPKCGCYERDYDTCRRTNQRINDLMWNFHRTNKEGYVYYQLYDSLKLAESGYRFSDCY